MTDALTRWNAGARAPAFTPAEAGAVAEHLMARHPAYRDHRHPDHQALSQEVAELMQRAHPGELGPGGEVIEPTNRGPLWR